MGHGKKRIPNWIDRRLTGLAGPEYHAIISFGLPIEPEDSQYGKYWLVWEKQGYTFRDSVSRLVARVSRRGPAHGQGCRWTGRGVEPPSCGSPQPAALPQSTPRTGASPVRPMHSASHRQIATTRRPLWPHVQSCPVLLDPKTVFAASRRTLRVPSRGAPGLL